MLDRLVVAALMRNVYYIMQLIVVLLIQRQVQLSPQLLWISIRRFLQKPTLRQSYVHRQVLQIVIIKEKYVVSKMKILEVLGLILHHRQLQLRRVVLLSITRQILYITLSFQLIVEQMFVRHTTQASLTMQKLIFICQIVPLQLLQYRQPY